MPIFRQNFWEKNQILVCFHRFNYRKCMKNEKYFHRPPLNFAGVILRARRENNGVANIKYNENNENT